MEEREKRRDLEAAIAAWQRCQLTVELQHGTAQLRQTTERCGCAPSLKARSAVICTALRAVSEVEAREICSLRAPPERAPGVLRLRGRPLTESRVRKPSGTENRVSEEPLVKLLEEMSAPLPVPPPSFFCLAICTCVRAYLACTSSHTLIFFSGSGSVTEKPTALAATSSRIARTTDGR